MLDDFNLDLSNDEVSDGNFAPKGDFVLEVERSELKETKDGKGYYINMMLSVVGEKFNNAKFFKMFNVKNESKKAVEIGRSQLKGMLVAAGEEDFVIKDPSQLVGLRVGAYIAPNKDGEGSEIKRFKKLEEVTQEEENTSSDSFFS